MLTHYDSNSNLDDLTDAEIYDAIRYLERDHRQLGQQNSDHRGTSNGIVICVCLSVALLLADLWFYWR